MAKSKAEHDRLYRLKHKEEIRTLQKAWYTKNKERLRPKSKEATRRWRAKHPDAAMKAFSAYRQRYPERVKASMYKHDLKRKYGLTPEQVQNKIWEQGWMCAICDKRTPKILNIDHCHRTGKFRGMLCINCNLLLGNAMDSIEILEQAIAYLRVHGASKFSV